MKTVGIIGGIGPESTKLRITKGIPLLDTTRIHVEAIVEELVR
jgi:aspartate/glutamate racemase